MPFSKVRRSGSRLSTAICVSVVSIRPWQPLNGLTPAAHFGRRPDELLPGLAGLDRILEGWRRVIETGESWGGVEVHRETPAQPGVLRSWTETFFPVRVDGHVVGLGIAAEETTLQREARRALQASEARFRGLIELGPIGISLSEPDGRIVLANDALLSMLGYRREEAIDLNWRTITPAEYSPLDDAHLQALREGQQPSPFEKEYIRRDGSRVSALIVARFLPGESERMMAYALDVTELRAAERKVHESAANLRRVIDHMAGVVSMLDREGAVVEVGAPALSRGHLTREEVVGRKFWDCPWWTHDPVTQARVKECVLRALAGETVREDLVARVADDEYLTVDFMLAPVFDANGRVSYVIPSGVDISDRKRMEVALRENEQRLAESAAALREADRRKDDFLATLAHELRNPLAPIRNGIELLRLIAGANPSLERTTQMMERQMRHLVRLVDDLLDVSRITRGKIQLRRELLPLNQVVSAALESSETLFEPHGHTVSVTLSSEQLCVLGDPDRLRQVFSNLLSNAAKFTPPDGTIWVKLERDSDYAKVSVRDTGIGIPPDRLGHVFEMFAQVNAQTGNDGLGIGLALAKRLVTLQGGSIDARSEGVGKGSEFIVCFPLIELESEIRLERRSTDAHGAKVLRDILIVDDNVDGAASLAEMLRIRGHTVQTVNGGAEAVSLANRQPPEIILMDLGMPGMDGLTAARLIRQQPHGSEIRIIALTGWGQDSDRERSQAAGIGEHLVKPVNPEVAVRATRDGRPEAVPMPERQWQRDYRNMSSQ